MSDSDRELLEKAAKAAGIELVDRAMGAAGYVIDGARYWNPLTDDGDALRLAVRLGIDLVHFTGHMRADVRGMPDVHEMHGDDPCAATRRAIVRAAAAIWDAQCRDGQPTESPILRTSEAEPE